MVMGIKLRPLAGKACGQSSELSLLSKGIMPRFVYCFYMLGVGHWASQGKVAVVLLSHIPFRAHVVCMCMYVCGSLL